MPLLTFRTTKGSEGRSNDKRLFLKMEAEYDGEARGATQVGKGEIPVKAVGAAHQNALSLDETPLNL